MRPIIAIATLVACLIFVSDSKAHNGFGGGFYSGLPYHGFGYSGSLYGLGYIPVPPYFSIHPPVYYGERIRRSYGDSPYAYGPRRPAPRQRPQVVVNPYMPETQQTSQEPDEKVAATKIIRNPFYGHDEQIASFPEVQINPYALLEADLAKAE